MPQNRSHSSHFIRFWNLTSLDGGSAGHSGETWIFTYIVQGDGPKLTFKRFKRQIALEEILFESGRSHWGLSFRKYVFFTYVVRYGGRISISKRFKRLSPLKNVPPKSFQWFLKFDSSSEEVSGHKVIKDAKLRKTDFFITKVVLNQCLTAIFDPNLIAL